MLEEVMVTAQKRTESIQDVPLSIVAMSEERLEKAGIVSADDLTRIVPALNIATYSQDSAVAIRIRGVGNRATMPLTPAWPLL